MADRLGSATAIEDIARGALWLLIDLADKRQDDIAILEEALGAVRDHVPSDEWAPVRVALGAIRLRETQGQVVREQLRQTLQSMGTGQPAA